MMALCTPSRHPFDMFPAIDDLMRHTLLENRYQTRAETVREPSYSYMWDDNGGTLEVEMPGARKEDITVEVHGRNLKITGKRHRGVGAVVGTKRAKVTGTEDDASSEDGGKLWAKGGTERGDSNVERDVRQSRESEGAQQKTTENGEGESAGRDEKMGGGNADNRSGVTVYKSSFRLSDMVDSEGIDVQEYRDGVLRLRLRRRERAGARKITIQ